jgi:hypothetical protein
MAAYAGLILRLVNIVEPWQGHHAAPQSLHDEAYEVFWESRLPPHEFLQLMREADRMGLVSPAAKSLWGDLTVKWMQRQMQGVNLTGYRDRSQPEDAATLVNSMPAHYLTGERLDAAAFRSVRSPAPGGLQDSRRRACNAPTRLALLPPPQACSALS